MIASSAFQHELPEVSTLVELLRWRALQQPDQSAYIFLVDGEMKETRLTYGELDQRARAIGAFLQSSQAAGERALLLYPPGLDYIAAFFGCLYAGVIAVPAYPPRPSRLRNLSRIRAIINDCQPTSALTIAPMQLMVKSIAARNSDFQALKLILTDELDPALSERWQEPSINERTLAFLQYTSGSTATPKGVMVSHGNLMHNERLIKLAFQQDRHSVVVGWLPLYHDMGLIGNVLQPLYVGAPCILMSPTAFLLSPYQWLRTISEYRATTSGGPNFAYDLCTRKITQQQRESLDLSSWTTAFNGAEPIREHTMERFAAAFQACGFRREAFAPCYGLAEATLIVSGGLTSLPMTNTIRSSSLEQNRVIVASAEEENTQTLVSSGAALLDQKVVVVEPEKATLCPPDQVGEIWVSGPSVAQGYWNRPDETFDTFHAYLAETGEGPFLRTGDLGFMKNGQLFVTGRLKDLIVIRGRNLYPQDIERTTEQSHSALRPASGAAFSVEVAGEERLVVVQEIAQRQVVNPTEIFDAIRQVISEEYELQAYAIVLLKFGTIPKTSSGKIQRHACRIGFQNGSLEVVGEWRASITSIEDEESLVDDSSPLQSAEAIEHWLALRLAGRLKRDVSEIDVKQPIARYGLDSLLAMELTHNIEAKLGVVLPVVSFLQSLSISQIAAKAVEELMATPSYGPAILGASGDLTVEQPLSYGQRALWFLHQLAPASNAYNIARAVRIRSRLNISALRRAFQTLVDRHASLRTTFKVVPGGEPVQEVHQQVEVCFCENDALNWSEEELNERLVAEAHLPFDLENGPLLRVSVFQRSTREHVLLLALHHIVADFWSLAVLVNELGILYRAENSGVQVTLTPLSLLYSDYASWQQAVLTGAIGEQLRVNWEKQLGGELPLLNLPTDYPRPPIQTYNGASQPFTFSPELTEGLKAICQSRGTTLFMVLLAAFDVLLHHYTGQDDLVVGSPTAGRSLAETVGVVGYFVNPVALRADVSGNPTFEEFLDRVRQSVIKAFEHQDYPFALLVQQLQPERDPSRSPLFQTMFVFQKAHLLEEEGLASFALGEEGARMQLGGLSIESVALPQRIAQFDLTLTVAEVEKGLAATLEYNTDLFERGRMVRMAEHYENLIASVVKEGGPGQRIGELGLLGEREREQLLVGWNETEREYEQSDTLLAMFEAQVKRGAERVALVDGQGQLSYGEVNERANQLAHYLRGLGVGVEQRVGVLLPRTTELVVGLLGIVKAGGAYVPLEVSYPEERLRFMLNDAGARVVVTTAGLKERLGEGSEQGLRVVCVDEEAEAIGGMSRANPECETVRTNLAYLIYTSGSTGQPKGVAIEHGSATTLLQWSLENFTKEELAVVLAGTSISFDLSVFEMFVPLSCGGTVVVAENALELPQLGAGKQVTLINTVPSAMKELLRMQAVPETTLAVNLAGEALSGQLVRGIYEETTVGVVRNLYGPSEDTTYSTCARLSAGAGEPSIGRPIANTQAYVLDQRLEPVAMGVVGELYRSEERRVGKSVDLGGRRIIKKKKRK